MKKIILMFIAIMGLLSIGSPALAGGLTIFGDYSVLNIDQQLIGSVDGFSFVTLGGEYTHGIFIAGGSYSIMTGLQSATPVDMDSSLLALYGGCSWQLGKALSLSGLGGYLLYHITSYTTSEDGIFSAFAAGVQGALDLGPLRFSATYLLGLGATFDFNGNSYGDCGISYLECKGTYQFGKALGAYVSYRWLNPVGGGIVGGEWNLDGFGAGLQYSF